MLQQWFLHSMFLFFKKTATEILSYILKCYFSEMLISWKSHILKLIDNMQLKFLYGCQRLHTNPHLYICDPLPQNEL